jgi:hypothetical protein
MNPIWHSESAVKQWGGTIEDYLKIHEKMDCSKAWISDNRHRTLTHTMFWVIEVMIPIFGSYITLESGRKVSVKDICERHILEDFKMKFIPTPQDFIQEMDFKSWMQNGNGVCPSAAKLYKELVPQEVKTEEVKPEKTEIKLRPPFRPNKQHLRVLDGTERGRGGYESKILD